MRPQGLPLAEAEAAAAAAVKTRLYLVRHCDVENPEGVLYGHLPNFGLSAKGRQQADAQGRFFADKPVRQIYVSPLQRAQETAAIIGRHIPGVPIVTTDELVEARFGLYLQGAKPRDVPWKRPLWFVHKAWPGLLPQDESVAAMAARTRAPLQRLLRDFPGEGGICISHGDPIQAFWNRVEGKGRFLTLGCAKGGLLQIDFVGRNLESVTYRPPESLGGEPAEPEPLADIVNS